MMKHKYELKRYLKAEAVLIVLCLLAFLVIQRIEYRAYNYQMNRKIEHMVNAIHSHYPALTDDEVMELLKDTSDTESGFLKKYNVQIEKDTLVQENEDSYHAFFFLQMGGVLLFAFLLTALFLWYNHRKDTSIAAIVKSIEEINKGNYTLDLDSMSEDELSILRNEVYKTTIMLREQAQHSKQDKMQLKDSLSDISHQLKTPLTSIMILLDNLLENPQMDADLRNDFIRDIKMETTNIHVLVQSILKLSQLDADAVSYHESAVSLRKLLEKSTKKVLPLCDLRDVTLHMDVQEDTMLQCDEFWQIEALSNIIKNCVEHSPAGCAVTVTAESNQVYTQIRIADEGPGIAKEDVAHIFERFYKGKHASENGIGIGLALAKAIINKNNGVIRVDTKEGEGTCFVIRYYK